jgi:hypothetical protein
MWIVFKVDNFDELWDPRIEQPNVTHELQNTLTRSKDDTGDRDSTGWRSTSTEKMQAEEEDIDRGRWSLKEETGEGVKTE